MSVRLTPDELGKIALGDSEGTTEDDYAKLISHIEALEEELTKERDLSARLEKDRDAWLEAFMRCEEEVARLREVLERVADEQLAHDDVSQWCLWCDVYGGHAPGCPTLIAREALEGK